MGASLGDVDVLAADLRHKLLWVIECKAISPGRMPHELHNELRKLFVGTGGKGSAVEKHARREAHVRAHVGAALAQLGPNRTAVEGWAVEALIVVDQELATPYLRQSPVRVVPLEHLRSLVAPSERFMRTSNTNADVEHQ